MKGKIKIQKLPKKLKNKIKNVHKVIIINRIDI